MAESMYMALLLRTVTRIAPRASVRRAPTPCPANHLHALAASRSLSTGPARRQEQASWDSFDDKSAFKPATRFAEKRHPPSPRSPPRAGRGRWPSTRWASAKGKGIGMGKRKGKKPEREPEPPLPPLSRSATVSSLDPIHLHDYRLSLMQKLHRPPTSEELDRELYSWLRGAYTAREQGVAAELDKARRMEQRRVQLDLAWEWERQAAMNAGISRSEHEKKKDEQVLERIAQRKREEREARELARDLQAADALLPPSPASSTGSSKHSTDAEAHQPEWRKHQQTMRAKFPTGWAPPKRLSREAMDLVRTLARSDPEQYSVPRLSTRFKISPEAVRRILKSRFELPEAERVQRERKRKEARARMSEVEEPASRVPPDQQNRVRGQEHGTTASPAANAWGGDRAAEKRELRQLRARKEQAGGNSSRIVRR